MSELLGADKVQKELERLAKVVSSGAIPHAMAEEVYDYSQQRVPVLTGELKGSGDVSDQGNESEVTYDADHAPFVEYGTSRMAAQPYLRPAMDRHNEILRAAAEALKKELGL